MTTQVYFVEDRVNEQTFMVVHREGSRPDCATFIPQATVEDWIGYWTEDEPEAEVHHFVYRDDPLYGESVYRGDSWEKSVTLSTTPSKNRGKK